MTQDKRNLRCITLKPVHNSLFTPLSMLSLIFPITFFSIWRKIKEMLKMSAQCSLGALYRFLLVIASDGPTDGSNISLYYSNISISMLAEHLVSCQVHKRTRTWTTTRSPDCKPDCHPPQNEYWKTKLQARYPFTLTAKATNASMMNLPSRQKDSQIHLLIQQTCQADELTDRPTSIIWWTFQEHGQRDRHANRHCWFSKHTDRLTHSVIIMSEILGHMEICVRNDLWDI